MFIVILSLENGLKDYIGPFRKWETAVDYAKIASKCQDCTGEWSFDRIFTPNLAILNKKIAA